MELACYKPGKHHTIDKKIAMKTLALFLICFAIPYSAAADLVVMSMGDSHTIGGHGSPSGRYRTELNNSLFADGIDANFVGEFSAQGRHQAVAGKGIGYMTNHFGSAVANYQPDVILVLAGTNNHFAPPVFSDFVDRYNGLLDMIEANSPGSEVIISTVPKFAYDRPDTPYWTDEWVDYRNEVVFPNMNDAIYHVASSRDWVSVVDLYSIVDIENDYATDAVHLNLYGQQKLAGLFHRALTIPEPGCLLIFPVVLVMTGINLRIR